MPSHRTALACLLLMPALTQGAPTPPGESRYLARSLGTADYGGFVSAGTSVTEWLDKNKSCDCRITKILARRERPARSGSPVYWLVLTEPSSEPRDQRFVTVDVEASALRPNETVSVRDIDQFLEAVFRRARPGRRLVAAEVLSWPADARLQSLRPPHVPTASSSKFRLAFIDEIGNKKEESPHEPDVRAGYLRTD